MPTYEYKCLKCGKRFAAVHRISQHNRSRPACPKCKGKAVQQLFSSFFAKTTKKS